VGYDVDTFLLDSLAEGHHGTSVYVKPGDALDEIVSGFYAHISTPVLTSLTLDFGGLAAYDIYPQPLPDLFSGSQIIAVGRYRQGGAFNVTLTGQVEGQSQTFRYDEQVFTSDSRGQPATLASLPRLWATRKVGYLLNQVRLKGSDQETVNQIVSLSIRYGIVTPYTSYLVSEPQSLGADAQQSIANNVFSQLQSSPAASTTGKEAVDRAAGGGGMANAEAPASAPADLASQVKVTGARAFLFTNNTWTDTRFDPKSMTTVKVAFLSSDYFTLSQTSPDLAAALALGEGVIVGADGVFYEVVAEGTVVPPLRPAPSLTPAPAVNATLTPTPATGTGTAPAAISTPGAANTPLSGLTPTPRPTSAPSAPACLGALAPIGLALLGWRIRGMLRKGV
jgi:Ca-activated chloride channel family protein